jgi:hypothetical protein
MLADLTGKRMSTQLHDIYFNALDPLGIDSVNRVLLDFVEEIKFPSIIEIKSRLGFTNTKPDDDAIARMLFPRILKAVEKHGSASQYHITESKALFSDEEWSLITSFLSWPDWCNDDIFNYENQATISAQFREYAKAISQSIKYDAHLSLTNKISGLIDINSLSKDLT